MFGRLSKIWNDYGFEITLVLSILFMLILAFIRIGKKGTWSSRLFLPTKQNSVRRPPQESKGEIECRKVVEDYFKKPFPKARPNFLRNPITSGENSPNNLELDCYNDELRIAVEYNGVQHYKYIPYFHKSQDGFHNQKYRDYIKRDLCVKNGIFLIEVPYTVKVPDIKGYILDKLSAK